MKHNQKEIMNPSKKFAEVIIEASQKPHDVSTDCKIRLEEAYLLFAEKYGLTQKCKFLIIHGGFIGSGDPCGFRIRALVTSPDPHFDIISVNGLEQEMEIEVPEGRFKLGIELKGAIQELSTKKLKITVSVERRQRKTKKDTDYGSQSHDGYSWYETGGSSGGGRFY